MSGTSNILPCPFCGHSASLEDIEDLRGVRFSVGCDSTDEESCMGYQSLTTFNTRKQAIEAWNKRAPAARSEAKQAEGGET